MSQDALPTRQTLLLRLRDQQDHASWEEFAEVYCPLLYSYCLRRGISPEDTADIVQEVMRSVSIAMPGFAYDQKKGSFKGWLFTALRNAVGKHFKTQAALPKMTSETSVLQKIEDRPSAEEESKWERDYQVRLLSWAMEQVKPEFGDRVWEAFERTAIRGESPEAAAAKIGMTKNALGVARHRVLRRLTEKAASVDPGEWESEVIAKSGST